MPKQLACGMKSYSSTCVPKASALSACFQVRHLVEKEKGLIRTVLKQLALFLVLKTILMRSYGIPRNSRIY